MANEGGYPAWIRTMNNAEGFRGCVLLAATATSTEALPRMDSNHE